MDENQHRLELQMTELIGKVGQLAQLVHRNHHETNQSLAKIEHRIDQSAQKLEWVTARVLLLWGLAGMVGAAVVHAGTKLLF